MKKQGHILIEYGVFFLLVFLVMTAVVAVLTFVSTILMAVENESETAYTRAYNAEELLTRYKVYPYLVGYWTEHIDEIKDYSFDERNENALLRSGERLLSKYGVSEPGLISEEIIESMTEDEKKVLALLTYQSVQEDFRLINYMQKVTLDGPLLVGVSDEGEMTLLVKAGTSPFEVGDEISTEDTDIRSLYAGAKAGISHAEENIVNIPKEDGGIYSAVAYPVLYEGKLVAITLIGAFDLYIRHVSLSQTGKIILAIVIIAFISGVILLLMLYFGLIRPIGKVQVGVRTYTQDFKTEDLVSEMEQIKSKNEIGRLADDIGIMAQRIKEYSNERTALAADKAKMESEISLAANIQKSFLPDNFPDADTEKRFELYASMKPAKAVGGDFYDFFMIDDDHLAMLIADVSDKGIGAAMFMMTSKTVITNNAMLEKSPAKAIWDSNNTLLKNNEANMFLTAWLGVLELSTGKLVACNAGHESPIIRQGDKPFCKTKDKRCFLVGGFEGVDFDEYELQLQPGDRIFLFTDGVKDAADADENRFGTERLLDVLNKDRDASPEQMIENVRAGIRSFVKGAEQFDDITMLAMEYKNPGV